MKKHLFKYALTALIPLLCIVSLTACNRTEQYFVYGGIPLEIQAEGSGSGKLCDEIADYIDSLEPIVSPIVQGSDLWKINEAEVGVSVACRDATIDILRAAERIYKLSGGAYDPSVYPLVELWGFAGNDLITGIEKTPPEKERIEAVKQLVGLDKVFEIDYANKTVTKKVAGAKLDFGGVAKGYAADKARKFIGKQKVLIYLGGNISVKNKNYPIGIEHPRTSGTNYGTIMLKSGECISTSGDYERNFHHAFEDGEVVFYNHVLYPSTGYPSGIDPDSERPYADKSDILISVSVVTADGALGDALSTAVMVLGKAAGTALLNGLIADGTVTGAVLIDSGLNCVSVGGIGFSKA